MKKVLVTGINSFVGNSFENWVSTDENIEIYKISLRDDEWKTKDFSSYDTVLHVAGIAHVSTDSDLEDLYYKINRDLTVSVASKAKEANVKQFIFMSSMIVYGDKRKELKNITLKTTPQPNNFYGKSKLEAENTLRGMENNNFKVAIIRPPMIYGKNSKGNYPKLSKLARLVPIFPNIDNKRSMLHIDNLSEFIKKIILNKDAGIFFPQNEEYVNTSHLVKTISMVHNRKLRLVKIFNFIIVPCINRFTIFNKVFGDLAYDKELSQYKESYCVNTFKESIEKTEK